MSDHADHAKMNPFETTRESDNLCRRTAPVPLQPLVPMCMQSSQVRPYQKWHWAGDEIVPNPIIPASRVVPGTKTKRYPIDIREYLSIEDNAVVRRELHRLLDQLSAEEREYFFANKAGYFDFRADKVRDFVGRLKYLPTGRRFDTWQFPDETLAMGGGDCEDLAFLFAAMLHAAGISDYCLRVALGSVQIDGPTRSRRFDHAWVVYQNEDGAWEILEPMAVVARFPHGGRASRKAVPPTTAVEYTPHFVFNSRHLWRVRGPDLSAGRPFVDYLADRVFWTEFGPTFAAGVHSDIYDQALQGMAPADLSVVKRASLWVDVNVLAYDPRDHFDFAYLPESWQRAKDRLSTGKLRDFGLATHSIADFYAHTLYGEFGRQQNGALEVYDPDAPDLARPPSYDFHQPNCTLPGCSLDANAAAAHWQGQIISGQWWRWYSTFPDDLEGTDDFKRYRRCLPDHDFLAVDSPKYSAPHHYSADEYQRQFGLRRAAAIAHVRAVYQDWQAARH